MKSLAQDPNLENPRPADDAHWPAIVAFVRRPWFRRLWVLQELAFPKDIIVICERRPYLHGRGVREHVPGPPSAGHRRLHLAGRAIYIYIPL